MGGLSRSSKPTFKAADLHWPSASFPSIVVGIRLPEDPDTTWPWTVDTSANSNFSGITLPRHSYLFSTPAGTAADQAESSRLTFQDPGLTPQKLATTSGIYVEVLPRWLRLHFVQKHKEYLVAENAVCALVVAAVTCLAGILIVPHKNA